MSNSFDETLGLGSGSENQSETSGSLAELDLTRLPDFYKAMGWQADAEAAVFFDTVRLEDLSLEELKVLYLMQLTEEQKMSDPLAILCQLESKRGEQ